MSDNEHNDYLLTVFLKALDKVGEMSGILKSIQVSLNDDIKPELKLIKIELKDKANLNDHEKHDKSIKLIEKRVSSIENMLENKEKIKKSWVDVVKIVVNNWHRVLILIVSAHYILNNFILKIL